MSTLLGEENLKNAMWIIMNVLSCEREVLLLCGKYDVSKPSVHEVMRDVENLNKIFSSRGIPLTLESRLVTAVANHPCLLPENPLNAEVQVNSLLPYLSSPCRWTRSVACSLLRVFASGLDLKGQHIETQGKKNKTEYLVFIFLAIAVIVRFGNLIFPSSPPPPIPAPFHSTLRTFYPVCIFFLYGGRVANLKKNGATFLNIFFNFHFEIQEVANFASSRLPRMQCT